MNQRMVTVTSRIAVGEALVGRPRARPGRSRGRAAAGSPASAPCRRAPSAPAPRRGCRRRCRRRPRCASGRCGAAPRPPRRSAAPRRSPRPRPGICAPAPCGNPPTTTQQRAAVRQRAAHLVMAVEIADHPAAAMHEEQAGQGGRRLRAGAAVAPQADRAGGAGAGQVLDLRHLRRLGLQHGARVAVGLARLLRRQGVHGRAADLADQGDDAPGIGVERHGGCVPQLVQARMARATSSGLSSSARWPAPGMMRDLVRAAEPLGEALRRSCAASMRSCSPQSSRVGALISGRRFSSWVLPSGQKMRAAASAARVCSIGHSGGVGALRHRLQRLPGLGVGAHQPGHRPARCAQGSVGGSCSSNRPKGAISARRSHRPRPDRRDLGGQRGADRAAGEVGAVEPGLRRAAGASPAASRGGVEHGVAAVAAGEAGQGGHDRRCARFASASRNGIQRGSPPKPARKPSFGPLPFCQTRAGKPLISTVGDRSGSDTAASARSPPPPRLRVQCGDGARRRLSRDCGGGRSGTGATPPQAPAGARQRGALAAAIGCGHQRSSHSENSGLSCGSTFSANSCVLYLASSLPMLPNCSSSIRWPTLRLSPRRSAARRPRPGEPMMT